MPQLLTPSKRGRKEFDLQANGQTLYSIKYAGSFSSGPGLEFFRGPSQQPLGSAVFHSFSSDKIDITFGQGHSIRYKKAWDSVTGLGEVKWHSEKHTKQLVLYRRGPATGNPNASEEGHGSLSKFLGLSGEKEGERGQAIAVFRPQHGSVSSTERQAGTLEITGGPMTPDQLDEVVVTAFAELERRRKETQAIQDGAEGVGEAVAAAVGGA